MDIAQGRGFPVDPSDPIVNFSYITQLKCKYTLGGQLAKGFRPLSLGLRSYTWPTSETNPLLFPFSFVFLSYCGVEMLVDLC